MPLGGSGSSAWATAGNHCSPARLAVALVLLCCGVLVSITFDADKVESLLLWVQENKSQGSLLFLALYIAGVILMLPAMVMAMASGAIFGIFGGALLSWIGSSSGQVIAFIIGRYLLRDIVLSYLTAQFPKWTAVDRALVSDGWKLVTLLRLSPIAPWNILNYALSVTSVPLTAYTVASSLAIMPYLFLFVYFGSMARSLADIFTGAAGLDTSSTIIMGIVSCAAMVGIVWYTTHISRKAVNTALRQHGEGLPPELTGDEDVVTLLGGPELGGGGGGGGGGNSNGVDGLEMVPPHVAVVQMSEIGGGSSGNGLNSSSKAGLSGSGGVSGGSSSTSKVLASASGPNLGSGSMTAITPTRGRQRSSAAVTAAAGGGGFNSSVIPNINGEEETTALVGKTPRISDIQQQKGGSVTTGLHVRSNHASPRSGSPQSARWNQQQGRQQTHQQQRSFF
jgi:uncharacterized membrane protein YdjX (TVP38/TMEM64 family)